MNHAPGPKGFWDLIKTLLQRQLDPIQFYEDTFSKFGDIAYIKMGEYGFLMLNDADAIEQVLQTDAKIYTKSTGYERFRLIFGNGLLTSNGEFWIRQRRLMAGAFSSKSIEKLHPLIVQESQACINDWNRKPSVDLADEMNGLTLQIISKTMLGDLTAEDSTVIKSSVKEILKYLQTSRHLWLQLFLLPFPIKDKIAAAIKIESKLPLPSTRKFFKAIKAIDRLVLRMIEERKRLNLNENLLDKLIKSTDEEDQSRMTNQQLRDEVVNILLAGHETTSNALAWTFHQLLKYPEVYQKVSEEIQKTVKGSSPSYEELSSLVYTQAVLQESMRLYPPFWRVSRQATVDTKVKGFDIPKGTNVVTSIYTIQRKEKHWTNSLEFRPERFLNESPDTHKFAYIPFGAGPRICIGSSLAMNEAITILATCLKNYELTKAFTTEPTPQLSMTMQPKEGCKVKIKRIAK
jgi:cytochrome P450